MTEPDTGDYVVPDVIGAAEGWRSFRVPCEPPRYGASPRLYSVSHSSYYWKPREVNVASCRRHNSGQMRSSGPGGFVRGYHVPPGENCTCGLYSARTLPHLLSMGYHTYAPENGDFCVIGRVANWGKVVQGSQGWRAEKSYPLELWVPFEMGATLGLKIRETYGVPVLLKNILSPDLLLKECM
jgi:hypothetical protein